jgi:transposase
MVVVGADVHKPCHTFVAVDEVGRRLGEKTVKASTAGHIEAIMWARQQFGTELMWGIEDCRNMSARLERDLLTAGQQVVRVPTKLMSQVRKSARVRGKSDPIDAEAVARAVLREPNLPVASHDEVSRELKLLIDRREVLVPNAPRRSTGCVGMSMNSIPAATPSPARWTPLSISRPYRLGWTQRRGWWPKWRAPNWPTSSDSPSKSTPWPSASASECATSPRRC